MGRRDLVQRGKRGEAWAARALRLAGYSILDRGWRMRGGELDIVAQEGDDYVFVEVKTRYNRRFGPPERAVTPRKRAFLHRAARQWLFNHLGDVLVSWRIDVVAVEMRRNHIPKRITIFRYFEA